jgi:integrase
VGRRRQHDRHLPQRVYIRRGIYYFAEPEGRWLPLGRDLATAMAKYSTIAGPHSVHTFADLLDRYLLEVLPKKAPRTRADQIKQIPKLRAAFGHLTPDQLTPRLVQRYRNLRAQRSKAQANQELALLSHVCATAIEWELMEANPCRDVKKYRLPPRTHYVTDEDYRLVWNQAGPRLRLFMDLALLTGQREGDLRALTWEQIGKEGVEFRQGKTGKHLIVTWSPALRAVIAAARRVRPLGPTVVSTRAGEPFNQSAFSSLWRRAMARAGEPWERRFRFHDLRAKSASDDSLTAASERLGHGDARLTQRVYRRAPARVRPLNIGRKKAV